MYHGRGLLRTTGASHHTNLRPNQLLPPGVEGPLFDETDESSKWVGKARRSDKLYLGGLRQTPWTLDGEHIRPKYVPIPEHGIHSLGDELDDNSESVERFNILPPEIDDVLFDETDESSEWCRKNTS